MDPNLDSTLLKLALPVLVIGLVLGVSKRRRLSFESDLGLTWPSPKTTILWVILWIVWIILTELALAALKVEPPKPWSADYSRLVVVLRIVAIGLLGPFSEELLMRGIIFSRICKTRVGPAGAIIICAVAWAAMHYRYEWLTIALIALDGVIFGLARFQSGSVLLPALMHVMGNLHSIYQSLHT